MIAAAIDVGWPVGRYLSKWSYDDDSPVATPDHRVILNVIHGLSAAGQGLDFQVAMSHTFEGVCFGFMLLFVQCVALTAIWERIDKRRRQRQPLHSATPDAAEPPPDEPRAP